MSDEIYWAKVAAIGQTAGALATFAAVVVALWLAKSERAYLLRVRARFGLILDVAGKTEVMTIEVVNIGLRKVTVTGFGWTTGFRNTLRILPPAFRLRSAFQFDDYSWSINPRFPWHLEPGESKMTHIRKADFIKSMTEVHPENLFRRLPLFNRWILLRHRVYVSISALETAYQGKVDPKMTKQLELHYVNQIAAEPQTSSTNRP